MRKLKKQVFSGKKTISNRGLRQRNVSLDEEKTQKYKEEWEIIFKENPNLKRTQLKALNQGAFDWLRRNDKAWLEKHLPAARWKNKNNKAYYIRMDSKLLQDAQQAYSNWPSYEEGKGKLQRITLNGLLTHMGISTVLVTENGHNYPLLKEFIESAIETKEEFQKRRIKHLLDNKFSDQIVTVPKIKQLASVYQSPNRENERYLEEQVELHNKKVNM